MSSASSIRTIPLALKPYSFAFYLEYTKIIVEQFALALMRILSKGSELPFVHESVGWDDSTNFKDYDIVFVNLSSLEETAQEFDHPYNESQQSPKIFDSSDVSTFIQTGGFMVVYLPDTPTVDMGGATKKTKKDKVSNKPALRGGRNNQDAANVKPYKEYNLLEWLPFPVNIDTDESGESVSVLEKEWEWYFRSRFKWNKIISHKTYTTGYKSDVIAENSYSKPIATKITKSSDRSNGHVAIIPPKESITYSEFVKTTLEKVFGIESNVEGRAPPAWLSEYILPKEDDIEDRIQKKRKEIEELEEELESITKYKKLLYETSTNLEEVTREALKELGFTVDSEVPGKRDGVLHTKETNFALEITGTTGGIKLSKGRQLDDWVENVMAENPDENISGLLIVNPEMGTSPGERDISIEPNVKNYMRQRGDYKILTTIDLYRLIEQNFIEGVEKEEVEDLFSQDETLLSLPDKFSK